MSDAALNRLLDSNRELLLPATGEVVKAHPDFQLFGTQNPAGLGVYGGRKMLSKALSNRFLQLQLEELGLADLRLILMRRCKLPASRAEPMLKVFRDLQQRRANSSVSLLISRWRPCVLGSRISVQETPFSCARVNVQLGGNCTVS